MAPVSKQDVQSMVNTLQNRIFERVALRQDVQALTDVVKNLLNIHQQNQQLLRQSEYQRLQLVRRGAAIEARMSQLEAEIRNMRIAMSKMTEQQALPQRLAIPAQPEPQPVATSDQYLYRPTQ